MNDAYNESKNVAAQRMIMAALIGPIGLLFYVSSRSKLQIGLFATVYLSLLLIALETRTTYLYDLLDMWVVSVVIYGGLSFVSDPAFSSEINWRTRLLIGLVLMVGAAAHWMGIFVTETGSPFYSNYTMLFYLVIGLLSFIAGWMYPIRRNGS